jgi:hypothetical protein
MFLRNVVLCQQVHRELLPKRPPPIIIIIREIRLVELDRLGVVQCNKMTSNVVKRMQFDAEFQAVSARNTVSSPHRSGFT